METIIYSSPKIYLIIDIKNLLNENNIPVSSIQLYITVNMDKHTKYGTFLDTRERRGELMVPIEEFKEKLNDAETLEINVEEEYCDKAFKLIEEWNNKNFYKYCIFKSCDYDEADNIQRLLIKNNIPCDDVYTNILEDNTEEYLIFLDPEFNEQANDLLRNNDKPKIEIIDTYYKKDNKNKLYEQELKENVSLRSILMIFLIIIIISILLYKFKSNIPIIDKIYNTIIELLNNRKQ
jgi:hypothetical protein